jgi:hypothetical protein
MRVRPYAAGVTGVRREGDIEVLLPKPTWKGVADGTITVAFRRWRRPTVRSGGTLRSPVGLLAIDEVTRIERDEVTDADARRAGAHDRDEVLAELDAREEGALYRIRFHLGGPDPRDELAADDDLTPEAVADLRRRLDRKDQGDPRGPWTRRLLQLIADHPHVVARELAPILGWERDELKRDVRKLKSLGLTVSHPVGYELSPRGRAFLDAEGRSRPDR